MTRKGMLVAAIGFTVFLTAASGANKSARDSAEERRVFANTHSNEAVRLSTAGLADKTVSSDSENRAYSITGGALQIQTRLKDCCCIASLKQSSSSLLCGSRATSS
jgi:hypothetical protein